MTDPCCHLLPDGTPVYSGYETPYDEYGVDLTLIDAMLALTPTERLAWLEEMVALVASVRPPADVDGASDRDAP